MCLLLEIFYDTQFFVDRNEVVERNVTSVVSRNVTSVVHNGGSQWRFATAVHNGSSQRTSTPTNKLFKIIPTSE